MHEEDESEGGIDSSDFSLTWSPQPGPQTAFVHCPVSEIFFGGR